MRKLWETKVNKTGYLLVFKQLQPIHLGIRGYGILSETRIFITGQTMWGALTNTYGKNKKWSDRDFKNDENSKIFETITCFFPSFSEDYDKTMMPKFKNGEFYLKNYSEKDFRNKFVDSFMSTAIQPTNLVAKDKSLHEMEVILPQIKKNSKSKKNSSKKLCWIGLLWVDNTIKNNFLEENRLEIVVGGDTRYGLGTLLLKKAISFQDEILDQWGVKKTNTNEEQPFFQLNDRPINNFLPRKKVAGEFDGKLELLAEFDFGQCIPNITKHRLCLVPGSKTTGLKSVKLRKGFYE